MFPDGKHADRIHLKPYLPIAKQTYESYGDLDQCIFQGYLENEPDSYVVLTNGCPMENSFEVTKS